MNCATHHSVVAVAYCRTCGKPLCAACVRDVRGTMFCEHCLAERVAGALPPTPPPGSPGFNASPNVERMPSPGMAAVLGFIPGVGAMYNGQFMKGFSRDGLRVHDLDGGSLRAHHGSGLLRVFLLPGV